MNMELAIEPFPETVEVSSKLIEPEKDRQPIKFLMKKQKLAGHGAFQEKSEKNKKVTVGVPSVSQEKKHSGFCQIEIC